MTTPPASNAGATTRPEPVVQADDGGCLMLSGIAGGTDRQAGGVFGLVDTRLVRLDDASTVGLHWSGGVLRRLLHSFDDLASGATLVTYDHDGLRSQLRLDEVVEPHDVVSDGDDTVVVSTGTNELLWFDRGGRRLRSWRAPGAPERGDAWHLNSLVRRDGRLLVCCFGRFGSHRAWTAATDGPTGEVVDTTTGETVLSGLDRPHNPRFVDGRWWACNSRTGELLRWRADGSRESVYLGGWTRGLHFDEDVVHVGVSTHRLAAAAGEGAELVTVDRRTLAVLRRLSCPSPEVYDVLRVPWALAAGVHAAALAGDVPLSGVRSRARLGEALGVTLGHRQPRLVLAGAQFSLPCDVKAAGPTRLTSEPPNPVTASYRWVPADGRPAEPWTEPLRTPLPPLAPGERATVQLAVATPQRPGWYRLEPTAVQEGVGWFEPVDPGTSEPVAVVAAE